MPYYEVSLLGSGIRFEFEDEVMDAFLITRRIRAPDAATAGQVALEQVRVEWGPAGQYAAGPGCDLSLTITGAVPLADLRALLTEAPEGYAFFRTREAQDATGPRPPSSTSPG